MGRKATDLTGMRFGKLVVVERSYEGRAKAGRPFWKCLCDCGNVTIVSSNHLKDGAIKSCGCGQRNNDLTGKMFGRWTAIKRERIRDGYYWLCRCECGTTRYVLHSSLVGGTSKSCGCYHREELAKRLSTHGMTDTRLYRIYYDIKSRCTNPKNHRYADYGGRGITLCDLWDKSFDEFANWAIPNGYHDDLSIDRIDNDGPYSPENCRWVSPEEQSNNKRTTIFIEMFGVKKSLKQWVEFMGWSYSKYHGRYYRGYEVFRNEDIAEIKQKLEKEKY